MQQNLKDWREVLSLLQENDWIRTIYVLGKPDSGKSWLCRKLMESLSKGFLTTYLDADPGQSVVGPPATVGLSPAGLMMNGKSLLRFVGATSPAGHLLQTVTGVKKLQGEALSLGYRKILVDSSGLATGRLGREFQYAMIDLLSPDCIVVLGDYRDFRSLLFNSSMSSDTMVASLNMEAYTERKSPAFRKSYRSGRFSEYFRGGRYRNLELRKYTLHGAVPSFHEPDRWECRICALCDIRQYVLALGIIIRFSPDTRGIQVLFPSVDTSAGTTILLGTSLIDPREFLPEEGEKEKI